MKKINQESDEEVYYAHMGFTVKRHKKTSHITWYEKDYQGMYTGGKYIKHYDKLMDVLSSLFEGWKSGLPRNSEAMFSAAGGYWMFVPNEKVGTVVDLIESANKAFLSNKYDEMELHRQAMSRVGLN